MLEEMDGERMNEDIPDSPFEPIEGDGTSDDMGGSESMDAGTGGPMDRLFNGSAPGPSVGELRADYQMPHWAAVMSRGIMRVATGDGVPPIAEIAIGGIMGVMGRDGSLSLSGDGDESSGEKESSGGGGSSAGAPPGVEL